jgi:group I intron endonuclease
MTRYDHCKIYTLINNIDDEIYVGSTCLLLHKRLFAHKCLAKLHPEVKVYNHLNTIGWNNVRIVLTEDYKCSTKTELLNRERYWIDILKPSLNTEKVKVPINLEAQKLKIKQYREANIHKYKEYMKKYNAENIDRIKMINKTKMHCDVCDCSYNKSNRLSHFRTQKHIQNESLKNAEINAPILIES